MASLQPILDRHLIHLDPVPPFAEGLTCPICRGPVPDGYIRCWSCNKLFYQTGASADLKSRVVPVSAVENPSPGYTRLRTYKNLANPDVRAFVPGVLYRFIQLHVDRFERLLGGPCDGLVFTPSKGRHAGGLHPLERVFRWITPELYPILDAVRFVGSGQLERATYSPEAFEVTGDVVGKRLLMLEDLWVSGRTVVSTAGALLEAGAAAVAIVVVARKTERSGYVPNDHPWWSWVEADIDLTVWPLR